MKIRYFFLAIAFLFNHAANAQKAKPTKEEPKKETSSNLVTNSGFEDAAIKTLKGTGQLTELCTPWLSPNKVSADLFAQGVKTTKAAAPVNDYGVQEPMTGTAYAGFMAYTKDPKKTRTYLQAKLTQKMVKNQLYCIRFSVSLADLSKFAVNNVGVFVSDRKIQNSDDFALTFNPQVTEKTNKAIATMDGWETICGTYIATGTEEYIVIGGFGTEDKMKTEKVKKPAGVTGTALNGAYYYIDNVEVVPVDAGSQCFCGKAEDREPDLIYSRSDARTPNMAPQAIINAATVYFAYLSSDVHGMFAAQLDEVIALMKANPTIKLELIGHSETTEVAESKINSHYNEMGLHRAEAVKKKLTEAGINESRIAVSSKDDSSPASTMSTPMSKAQNRRVELVVR